MTSTVRSLGLVLHPLREIAGPVDRIQAWAETHQVTVLGLPEEIERLSCRAVAISESEIADRADLLVALGGDGTVTARHATWPAPTLFRCSASTWANWDSWRRSTWPSSPPL